MKQTLTIIVLAGLCVLARPVSATVYYVSPSGSDSNAGTSTNAPWKTISHANSQSYNAGDQLLFQGGTTNGGTITFTSSAGTASNPILISSYGTSPAAISDTNADGFYAVNSGGLIVSNINFVGSTATGTNGCGIDFLNNTANTMRNFIRIANVDVGGFGSSGVLIRGTATSAGFGNVRITYVTSHNNILSGIQTIATSWFVHTNIYVGYCTVWGNSGTTAITSHTGDGILLGCVSNAVIEYCVAATNSTIGNAAAAIWCWYANDVTIQHCESHHNSTGGTSDGDGFDLDIGCDNCTVQYCYSHDNAGAGFPFYAGTFSGSPVSSNDVVRYCISQNDGRKNSYGAISFWNDTSDPAVIGTGFEVYNNTIFISAATNGTPSAINFIDNTFSNVSFYNNCIITTNGIKLINTAGTAENEVFKGNEYYASGDTFNIYWNGSTTYSTLQEFRTQAGQEVNASTNVGLSVNPELVAAGGGGILATNASQLPAVLPTLTAYETESGSPLNNAGLNLNTLAGINIGSQDFYGNPVTNSPEAVGAYDAPACITPNATISNGGSDVCANSTGNTASVTNAGAGATYAWTITNGTITAGSATNVITYTAGASGVVSLGVVVNTTNECSTGSGATNITIDAASVGGTAAATSPELCNGSGTTISLSGQTGTPVEWQSSTNGGNTWTSIASTANPLRTGSLTATTEFEALVQSGVCSITNSSAATVTVDTASVGGTATPTSSELCNGSSTTISLSGQTGAIVGWQYSVNGGSSWSAIASTNNPLSTGPLTVTTEFEALVQSGVCSTAASSAATVTVDQPSVGGTAAAGSPELCNGSGTTISLSGQTGAIVGWQSSTDGGNTWTAIASTSNPLSTGPLTVTTEFEALVQSGVCSTAASSAATVTVDQPSVGGTATATSPEVANGGSTTISLSGQNGAIIGWQSSTNGGGSWTAIASTNNPLSTGPLIVATEFEALVQSGVCSTATSSAASVTVGPSFTTNPTNQEACVGSQVTWTVAATGTGLIYQWQLNGTNLVDGVGNFSGSMTATLTNSAVSLTDAAAVTNGYACIISDAYAMSVTSTVVSLTVDAASVGGTATAASPELYSGGSTTISLSGQTGTITGWQSSTDGGNTWTAIASTSNPLSTGALTVTTEFEALVQSGVCSTATSSAATVTVLPLPTLSVVLASPDSITLSWSSSATNGFALEATTNLGQSGGWSNLFMVTNLNQVTLPASNQASFFRLYQP